MAKLTELGSHPTGCVPSIPTILVGLVQRSMQRLCVLRRHNATTDFTGLIKAGKASARLREWIRSYGTGDNPQGTTIRAESIKVKCKTHARRVVCESFHHVRANGEQGDALQIADGWHSQFTAQSGCQFVSPAYRFASVYLRQRRQ